MNDVRADRPARRFAGVVLAGGRSTRMGTDKAFLELATIGKPLVCVSRDALLEAGADRVYSVGGDRERLGALGFDPRPDDYPNEGPLGGLLTGLDLADPSLRAVVVLTCDLPAIDADAVSKLVDTLLSDDHYDAAVPVLDGKRQILTAAYRPRCRVDFLAAFHAGERSVRRVVDRLRVVGVEGIEPHRLRDLDRPDDLAAWEG
jgi:molybdopterin-guanine dinucleotide biosynthesis protein A